MSEMRLEEQINCIDSMEQYLELFCELMIKVMEDLSKQAQFLRGEGLSVETEETYRNDYFNPAKEVVKDVIYNIENEHMVYLEKVRKDLIAALEEK